VLIAFDFCHCERSEAIQNACGTQELWIATALQSLAMTE
jgi:hypothetical protein